MERGKSSVSIKERAGYNIKPFVEASLSYLSEVMCAVSATERNGWATGVQSDAVWMGLCSVAAVRQTRDASLCPSITPPLLVCCE